MTMRRKYPLPAHTINRQWLTARVKRLAEDAEERKAEMWGAIGPSPTQCDLGLGQINGRPIKCSVTGAPMWEYAPPEKPPVELGYAKSDEPWDVRVAKSMAHWGVR